MSGNYSYKPVTCIRITKKKLKVYTRNKSFSEYLNSNKKLLTKLAITKTFDLLNEAKCKLKDKKLLQCALFYFLYISKKHDVTFQAITFRW